MFFPFGNFFNFSNFEGIISTPKSSNKKYRSPCFFKSLGPCYLFTVSIDWTTILCFGNVHVLICLIMLYVQFRMHSAILRNHLNNVCQQVDLPLVVSWISVVASLLWWWVDCNQVALLPEFDVRLVPVVNYCSALYPRASNHHLQQGHLQCIFSWSWSESSTYLSYVSLGKTVWYLNTNQMTVSKLSLSDAHYPFIRVQVGIYWTSMWKQETKKRTFEVAERKNESLTS